MIRHLIRKIYIGYLLLLACHSTVFSQEKSVEKLDQTYLNWYNHDPVKDNILGTSVDRVYTELLKNQVSKKTVIVAIIDSGVDIDHEDLKGQIWINDDEIAGNAIDDDKNGYVDDIHGWNFIGNKKGENISYETFEYTRIYKSGGGPYFDKAKRLYENELARQKTEKENINKFEQMYFSAKGIIKEITGITVTSLSDLDAITPNDGERVLSAKRFLSSRYERGFTETALERIKKGNDDYFSKFLNLNFNPRLVVGDDPNNITDMDYGNPDVKGKRSDHGTSVAGVVAALRDNGLGINGIATNVKLMCIRSTPRGDERDKDVALAIKYAVDNEADIINMSFGKAFSPQKQFVDLAVKLAEQKGVLIVHSAGNEGRDIDVEDTYPSNHYLDGSAIPNWITVGASGFTDNDGTALKFSNYGQNNVDVFAPGEKIISTDSSSYYNMHDGTSFSGPVVTGIAALILSYYPDLKPQQMIAILQESTHKIDKKVFLPGLETKDPKKVKFRSLSKSGGIVNAFEAFKRASGR